MRWIADLAVLAAAVLGLISCGCGSTPAASGAVRIAGSDTMLPVNRRLAEAFMRGHPGIPIHVQGGSTGRGVERLLDGSVDLCAASRPFRPQEISRLYDRFGTMGLRFLVARDALSVLVHPANPVRSVSMSQLAEIFSGRIVNWSRVGGPDAPIEVVLRPPNSGTYHFFRDHVLVGDDYASPTVTALRASDVDAAVLDRPYAIGYGGLVHHQRAVALGIDGVEPSAESVRRGEYPLARYLLYYAPAPPKGSVRVFLEWCVSREGQQVVEASGFIPLWTDG